MMVRNEARNIPSTRRRAESQKSAVFFIWCAGTRNRRTFADGFLVFVQILGSRSGFKNERAANRNLREAMGSSVGERKSEVLRPARVRSKTEIQELLSGQDDLIRTTPLRSLLLQQLRHDVRSCRGEGYPGPDAIWGRWFSCACGPASPRLP